MTRESWTFVTADDVKPHACPSALVEMLLSDLRERGHGLDHLNTHSLDRYSIDRRGMAIMGRPSEDFAFEGLDFGVVTEHVGHYLNELRSLPQRHFADGTAYYKLHSGWSAMVLRPEARARLIATLDARLDAADQRAATFYRCDAIEDGENRRDIDCAHLVGYDRLTPFGKCLAILGVAAQYPPMDPTWSDIERAAAVKGRIAAFTLALSRSTAAHGRADVLTVHTARLPVPRAGVLGYSGPDMMNVTRGSGGAIGNPFAPSRELLNEALRQKRAAKKDPARLVAAWEWYAPRYVDEMRTSWRQCRGAWDALIARELVTLCCYCAHPESCHRSLLAMLLYVAGQRVGVEVVLAGERP